MLIGEPIDAGATALASVKDFLRIDGAGEDAVLTHLVTTAIAVCENYTGMTLIERGFVETVEAVPWWRRLSAMPVVAVTAVTDTADGLLPVSTHGLDIDATGCARLRVSGGAARVARVRYRAGLASSWDTVPEPLRHGVVRMVAHLHQLRDQADALGPPAAALALWQGARRMRMS